MSHAPMLTIVYLHDTKHHIIFAITFLITAYQLMFDH